MVLSFGYDERMNFRQILAWLMFWKRGEDGANEMPPSIVLFTRRVHAFSKEELVAAAEKGWRRKFDGEEDPLWFVFVSDVLTTLKAGKYVVQLVQAKVPYSDDLEAGAQNLPREEQRKAWFEHQAWFSLDLWNGAIATSRELQKRKLMRCLRVLLCSLGTRTAAGSIFRRKVGCCQTMERRRRSFED